MVAFGGAGGESRLDRAQEAVQRGMGVAAARVERGKVLPRGSDAIGQARGHGRLPTK